MWILQKQKPTHSLTMLFFYEIIIVEDKLETERINFEKDFLILQFLFFVDRMSEN